MATLTNPAQSFLWGKNGQPMTPEQVARERQSAAMMAKGAVDFSPVQHWSQGLGRVVQGLMSGYDMQRADRADAEGLEQYQDWSSRLAQAQQASPVAQALANSLSPQTGPATIPQGTVANANSGVAGALAGSAGGLPGSLIQSESGGNWQALNSEGYGGRGQFGEARLADAARAGVIPAGMTGAQYSQQPPEVQTAVENWHKQDILGNLGQYVGMDIDGPGPIPPLTEDSILAVAHLGGTGGAQKFIQSGGAYNPSDSNGTSLADYAIRHANGGGTTLARSPAGGISPEIVSLLAEGNANPWVRHHGGGVIDALMGQQMQQQNAQYEQGLRQADPMYQAQLQGQMLQNQAAMQPEQQSMMNAGDGRIFNPNTGEWIVAPGMDQQYRPASTEEAAQYGASGGQFGPDGRFYPVNPPSGFSIETGPDGQMRVVQGPGAAAGGKPFTEGQSKDIGFATRARAALETFEPIAGTLTSRGQQALDAVPWGLGRDHQNPDYQIAQNSGTNFLLAVLRKDTGAAVTPDEERIYTRVFLPQPGDTDELLSQKSQARQLAVAGLEAGMPPEAILAQGQALLASGSDARPLEPVAPASPEVQPSGSVAAPMSKEQYDALPSGARFQAPDGSVRIKP